MHFSVPIIHSIHIVKFHFNICWFVCKNFWCSNTGKFKLYCLTLTFHLKNLSFLWPDFVILIGFPSRLLISWFDSLRGCILILELFMFFSPSANCTSSLFNFFLNNTLFLSVLKELPLYPRIIMDYHEVEKYRFLTQASARFEKS